MKNRKLLTDIFTVVMMAAIVLVLLAYLNVFPGAYDQEGTVSYVMLSYVSIPLALISVALIDLVFPLLDNKSLWVERNFQIKAGAKVVLFLVAVIFGILYMAGALSNVIESEFVGVGIFIALYIAQFCINLDPKPVPVEDEIEEADEYAQYDEDSEEDEE